MNSLTQLTERNRTPVICIQDSPRFEIADLKLVLSDKEPFRNGDRLYRDQIPIIVDASLNYQFIVFQLYRRTDAGVFIHAGYTLDAALDKHFGKATEKS